MKVHELITELQKHDPETEVFSNHGDYDLSKVTSIILETISLNVNDKHWSGDHEIGEYRNCKQIKGLVI